ncbi:MAG: penicillin-insensitive murein endopeptidase [Plesiomonas sp.]
MNKSKHRVIMPLCIAAALGCIATTVAASPWSQFTAPVRGAPQAIGGYANGCVVGAVPLPLSGKGYEVIRTERLRYFGHPELIRFITRLAQRSQQAGLDNFWVGDMAMPVGGRFNSGHASHQNGLDVDIWLRFSQGTLSVKQKQNPAAVSLVDFSTRKIKPALWEADYTRLIKLAATDPKVARIFVNPAIKKQLCETAQAAGDTRWLHKVRPWGGHDYHMHVRLDCPLGSVGCKAQLPPPAGDGCGQELTDWLRPPPPVKNKLPKKLALPKAPPVMPAACQALLP